jgi:hypothetical protein
VLVGHEPMMKRLRELAGATVFGSGRLCQVDWFTWDTLRLELSFRETVFDGFPDY